MISNLLVLATAMAASVKPQNCPQLFDEVEMNAKSQLDAALRTSLEISTNTLYSLEMLLSGVYNTCGFECPAKDQPLSHATLAHQLPLIDMFLNPNTDQRDVKSRFLYTGTDLLIKMTTSFNSRNEGDTSIAKLELPSLEASITSVSVSDRLVSPSAVKDSFFSIPICTDNPSDWTPVCTEIDKQFDEAVAAAVHVISADEMLDASKMAAKVAAAVIEQASRTHKANSVGALEFEKQIANKAKALAGAPGSGNFNSMRLTFALTLRLVHARCFKRCITADTQRLFEPLFDPSKPEDVESIRELTLVMYPKTAFPEQHDEVYAKAREIFVAARNSLVEAESNRCSKLVVSEAASVAAPAAAAVGEPPHSGKTNSLIPVAPAAEKPKKQTLFSRLTSTWNWFTSFFKRKVQPAEK